MRNRRRFDLKDTPRDLRRPNPDDGSVGGIREVVGVYMNRRWHKVVLHGREYLHPGARACPFCGAPATLAPWHTGAATQRWLECGSEVCPVNPSIVRDTQAAAVRAWNRRAAL